MAEPMRRGVAVLSTCVECRLEPLKFFMSQILTILGAPPYRVNARVRLVAIAAAIAVCLALGGGCTAKRPALLTADQETAAGLASLERGESTAAIRALERARAAGSKDDRVERGLAAGYVLAGDTQRAIALLARSTKDRPRDAHLWHLLGSLQLQSGDASGALVSLERAASLTGRWNIWRDLGEAQATTGRLDAAVTSLERAWSGAPPGALKAQVGVQLGDVQGLRGRVDRARPWYVRALAQDPQNEQAKARLKRSDGGR